MSSKKNASSTHKTKKAVVVAGKKQKKPTVKFKNHLTRGMQESLAAAPKLKKPVKIKYVNVK